MARASSTWGGIKGDSSKEVTDDDCIILDEEEEEEFEEDFPTPVASPVKKEVETEKDVVVVLEEEVSGVDEGGEEDQDEKPLDATVYYGDRSVPWKEITESTDSDDQVGDTTTTDEESPPKEATSSDLDESQSTLEGDSFCQDENRSTAHDSSDFKEPSSPFHSSVEMEEDNSPARRVDGSSEKNDGERHSSQLYSTPGVHEDRASNQSEPEECTRVGLEKALGNSSQFPLFDEEKTGEESSSISKAVAVALEMLESSGGEETGDNQLSVAVEAKSTGVLFDAETQELPEGVESKSTKDADRNVRKRSHPDTDAEDDVSVKSNNVMILVW